MRKLGIIVILSLAAMLLFAQDYQSVVELDLEQKLAERIEKLIEPILGFSIVEVDLTLKYPSDGLHPFGTDLDSKASLPGIPVAKSKGVLASEIAQEPTIPTLILSKKITIHVDQGISDAIINEQRNKFSEWLKIDIDKGDLLDIQSNIVVPILEESIEKNYTIMMLYIMLSIFLIIQIILMFIFVKKTDISSHLVD